jgi:hypothetical protein
MNVNISTWFNYFTGVIIDVILSQTFSSKNLIGGIIITIGLTLDM